MRLGRLSMLGLAVGAALGVLIIVAARALADGDGTPAVDPIAWGTGAVALAGAAVALWARWRAARAEARRADADADVAETTAAAATIALIRRELDEAIDDLRAARAGVRAADTRSDRQDVEITRLRAALEVVRSGVVSGDTQDVATLDLVAEPYRSSISPTGPMAAVRVLDVTE